MKMIKSETVGSYGIVVLLLLQVAISLMVVSRVNRLDQSIGDLDQSIGDRNTNVLQQPQVNNPRPSFVDDVSVDDDPWKGSDDAVVTLIEFADYQCPACAYATGIVENILREYPDQVKFVYRDFPLEHSHPNALIAAEAANCAGEQGKYWEMHDLLFANQLALDGDSLYKYAGSLDLDSDLFVNCLDNHKYREEVNHDFEDGLLYEVNSTPTFFVNGHRVIGANEAELRSKIEEILGS